MLSEATLVAPIRARLLDGVPHGFFGRAGGVSEGACAGLNAGYGSGDDRGHIEENRRRALAAAAADARLVTAHQIHSTEAVVVDEPWGEEDRPKADALVTRRPGIALGILTADCAPVLLADVEAGVIGAAHAGWKGALSGVVAATVAAMQRLGARPAEMVAAVGPCIGRRSYEVDQAFFDRFLAAQEDNDLFFTDGAEGRFQFDLEGYVLARVAAAGVKRIEALGLDTYADPARFFSYRRATHRGEPETGRQLSVIALR
jgi:polyphenol oxidase